MISRLFAPLSRATAHWPLATKLVVSVLALLVPVAGATFIALLAILRNTLTAQIGSNLHTVADAAGNNVGQLLAEEVSSLQALAQSQALVADVLAAVATYPDSEVLALQEVTRKAALWAEAMPHDPIKSRLANMPSSVDLRNFSRRNPDRVEVLVTDRYGGLVAVEAPPAKYQQSAELWWKLAYKERVGTAYISPPEYDPAARLYAVHIAVPVYEPQSDEIIGILHTRYRLRRLVDRLAGVRVGETGEAILLTADGLRLDSTGTDEIRIAADEWLPLRQAAYGWHIGPLDSRQSLMGYATVQAERGPASVNYLGWVVVIRQDLAESLAAPLAVERASALVAAFGLALIVLFTLVVARAMVRPVAELTHIAQAAQGGNLSLTAPVRSRDEIGRLSAAFNSMIAEIRNFTASLEQKVAERTSQLSAINEIAATISSSLDINQVLTHAVNLIRDRLGYYHVGIFLLDETGQTAVLREATGEIGRQLKERGHRLAVGSVSIIGYATANRQPRVALDVAVDAAYFKNPLLPGTRSELALPLMVGEMLLGALDVQSTEANAFDDEGIAVLQNMASQIAVAINNARLFEETQARLQEISALNRQYLGEAWDQYRRTHPAAVHLRLEAGQVRPAHEAEPPAADGASPDPTRPHLSADGALLHVPITLRDQVIGEFSLAAPAGTAGWTDDDLTLAQAVADQVALALDNARLLEETQLALAQARRLARRERIIGEVTDKIVFGADVKRVLQVAAEELRRATGRSRAVVRLDVPSGGPHSSAEREGSPGA